MTGEYPSPLGDHPGGHHALVPRFASREVQLSEVHSESGQRTLEVRPRGSHLELGALPTAPGTARAHTRVVLAEWSLTELSETAELLVSELVTNAVFASRALSHPLLQPVHLWLRTVQDRLLIVVWDAGVRPPIVQSVDSEAESGRGLQIVELLSARWGWYPTEDRGGKCVWCELAELPAP